MRVTHQPTFDRTNGWLEVLGALPEANVAAGDLAFDHVVVGAGYTGLAAARRLAERRPGASVALVEAGRIGNNAAGRCSGFAIDQAHDIRSKDFAASIERERSQLALNRAGQQYLRGIVRENAIECDWREDGKIHGAATEKGSRMLAAYRANLDLLGCEYRPMSAHEMRETCGTGFYREGLHTPGTVLIQPAAFVRGAARTMPANVTVFEDSPVEDVEYGPPHRLRTPAARLRTDSLLLANNGFGAGFGFHARDLIPLLTFGSLTRELTPDEQRALGGHAAWGLIPAHPFGTSVRRTVDNRILVRNIYSYSRGYALSAATRRWVEETHRASFESRFPMLPDVELEYTWGGALSLSRNGGTVFGELAPGVHASLCHNGVGIARGTICGKLLAELVTGEESPLLDAMLREAPPGRNPPEPLLGWGVRFDLARRRADAGLEL